MPVAVVAKVGQKPSQVIAMHPLIVLKTDKLLTWILRINEQLSTSSASHVSISVVKNK